MCLASYPTFLIALLLLGVGSANKKLLNRLTICIDMTKPEKSDASVPKFNVVVSMPAGLTLEKLEKVGLEVVRMDPKKLAVLVNAFRNGPQVMVGKEVTRERVDAVKDDLARMGLEVTVNPVLAIQEIQEGTHYRCPACAKTVELPENRQCPACGVFVDKVTKEFLLRKKIMEQERGKMALIASKQAADRELENTRSMEDAIRRQIRDELEEEFGLKKRGGLFQGRTGLMRATALFLLVGAAFAGGNVFNSMRSPAPTAAPAALAGTAKAGASDKQSFEQMLDAAGNRPGASAGDEGLASASAEPDAADSLVAAASQGRAGGKTLTLEQAIAAANILSGSIGGPTTQSLDAKSGSAAKADGAAPSATVPVFAKASLTSEFAVLLGEVGQTARANEVARVLMANPVLAADPQALAIAQSASLEVEALRITGRQESQTRSQLETLRLNAEKITSASERAVALARCAAILGRNPLLPKQASAAFITLATESAKRVTNAAQRDHTAGQVMLAMAELALSDTSDWARKGMWAKAQASASAADTIARQAASTPMAPQLMAIAAQAQQVLGQAAKSQQLLESALAQLDKEKNVPRRAATLRSVARLSNGIGSDKISAAAERLASAAEQRPQTEKAEALAQVALLHADAGRSDQFAQAAKRATTVAGLTPVESGAISSQVMVGGELAAARVHFRAQSLHELDERLKKVAVLLL